MNALLHALEPMPRRLPMGLADLDAVLAIEQVAYPFPWMYGNFTDSLRAGYDAELLRRPGGAILAYSVAMHGAAGETHLLNLTVSPDARRQGHARELLDALVVRARERSHATLWLEVRMSNLRARAVYERYGFSQVGLRRGYYPAGQSAREDACVMKLELAPVVSGTQGPPDALD